MIHFGTLSNSIVSLTHISFLLWYSDYRLHETTSLQRLTLIISFPPTLYQFSFRYYTRRPSVTYTSWSLDSYLIQVPHLS